MGWFDDQIRLRKQRDQEELQDAFAGISAALLRGNTHHGSTQRMQTKGAIDDILGYFGIKTREIPGNMESLEEQMEFLLRPSGVMHRVVQLEKGWHRDGVGPMMAMRRQDGAWVALIPGAFSGYTYWDAESGKRRRVNAQNAEMFEAEAICFYRPLPQEKLTAAKFLNFILRALPLQAGIMMGLLTLAAVLVGMITPQITRLLFGDVLLSGSVRVLLAITVFSISAAISRLLLEACKSMLLSSINTRLDIQVQAAMMARLYSLPADFFKQYSAGELASMTSYVNALCSMIVTAVFSVSLNSVFSLVYVVQIFNFAPELAVPALIVVALTLILTLVTAFMQMKVSRRQMELASKDYGMVYALIAGVQKLRLAGAEKRAFARWLKLYAQEVQANYRPPMLLTLSGVISTAIVTIGGIVIYSSAMRSGISVADYYAFNTAYGMVSGAFVSLAGIAVMIAQIYTIFGHIRPLLDAQPEVSGDRHMVQRLSGRIELDNVSFRYSDDMPMIVENLSLKVQAGQYVAIVGKTGCGKSTLVRLLLGFEQPKKGAIYYDGKDIKTLDMKSLRSHIGVVLQNGKLISDSVFANIAISAPNLTQQEVWEAAEMAGLADDIRKMPMGMHTMISEGSGGISGGQKQRLMIARAVAHKPKILIFDEATSALDNLTQKKVSDALAGLKCTRIVIAHRLSTIRQCDRILVLDQGRIIEDGTYDELLERKGFFAELVQRQTI